MSRPMYVIVATDNRDRGEDCLRAIYGPYADLSEASAICQELRASLPSEYESHEDNPIDYGVFTVAQQTVIDHE